MRVWDVGSGAERTQLSGDIGMLFRAISEDATLAVAQEMSAEGRSKGFSLWRLDEGRRIVGVDAPDHASALTIAPDGKTVLAGGGYGSLTLWNLPYFWLWSLGLCLLVRTGRRAFDRARRRHGRRAIIVGLDEVTPGHNRHAHRLHESRTDDVEVRLLDATGDPYDRDNLPRDDFERAAIKALKEGKGYYEQVVEKDGTSCGFPPPTRDYAGPAETRPATMPKVA